MLFNSLIYDLKKKNPKWGRTLVDDQDLTARALFTEEDTDEELWFLRQTLFNLIQPFTLVFFNIYIKILLVYIRYTYDIMYTQEKGLIWFKN